MPAAAAAQATDSMAGAMETSATLPGATGEQLLATARDAFSSGLHTVAGIGAAIVVVFAVVGMVALRRSPAAAEVAVPVASQLVARPGVSL